VHTTIHYSCKHCGSVIEDKLRVTGEYVHRCWIDNNAKLQNDTNLQQLKCLSTKNIQIGEQKQDRDQDQFLIWRSH
jgi:hypothetical protein